VSQPGPILYCQSCVRSPLPKARLWVQPMCSYPISTVELHLDAFIQQAAASSLLVSTR
jgi:hypothetical protein